MKIKLIVALLILFFGGNCIAVADAAMPDGRAWYGSLNIGYANIENEQLEENYKQTQWTFDDGINYSITAGYDFGTYRLEADASYRTFDFEKTTEVSTGNETAGSGDQNQYSLMINGIWEPLQHWIISPFLGAGLGYTKIEWDNVAGVVDDSDTVFTYQIIFGLSYSISNHLFIDATYKYIKPQGVDLLDNAGDIGHFSDQEINLFQLGVRYNF